MCVIIYRDVNVVRVRGDVRSRYARVDLRGKIFRWSVRVMIVHGNLTMRMFVET